MKYYGLDFIRGVAAILVFFVHFYGLAGLTGQKISLLGINFTSLFSSGHIGVNIFFVLSGYLIFLSIWRNGINKEYFKRRFLRIMPIYYISLFSIIFLIKPELLTNMIGLKDILYHIFFIQNFDIATYHGINPVLWSLSTELSFYIILPILYIFSLKKRYIMFLTSITLIILTYEYREWITQFYQLWDWKEKLVYTENIFGRFDNFAFGIIGGIITTYLKGKENNIFLKIGSVFLLIIGIYGLYFGLNTFNELGSSFRDVIFYQKYLHGIIGFSSLLVILGIVFNFQTIKNIFEHSLISKIGIISYSFYIWHFIIIQGILNHKEFQGFETYQLFVISFFITIIFSTITYLGIEKQFLKIKRYKKGN